MPDEMVGRAELRADDGRYPDSGGWRPGVEETGQIVVVTLITVVDVNTSVALATGQLVTLAAHLVMVYVDVVYTTMVVVPSGDGVRRVGDMQELEGTHHLDRREA